jgi:glycosyltransferase involved in cell wall biosynthesis
VLVDAARVVYYCVDRWDAYANYDSRVMATMDRRCCELADVVFASSHDLDRRCRRYNANVHLLSHGVDHALFATALVATARPADLPAGRIVGFFGLFSAWLDQDLLLEVARLVPECELVMIGRADVSVERLRGIRNVHLLGPRPFSQLPGYIAHFDVGLIPYVLNEFTMAVNPTKLREMLAAGCPVVSTNLPEVRAYRGHGVVVGDHAESFAAAVAKLSQNPLTHAERERISRGVANETWVAKVEELLSVLSSPL